MRAAAVLTLIGLLFCATADAAQITRITRKAEALRFDLPRPSVLPYERAALQSQPTEPTRNTEKLLTTPPINCESDGILDPFTTLLLDPGDMAGSIIGIPAEYSPYVLGELHLGLFDFNASYPAQLDLLILELDETGQSYDSIGAFTVDVAGEIAAEGEVLSVDLREFEIAGARELLVLYGDAGGGTNALLLPASDSSPRCAPENIVSVCGVLLPAGGTQLYIYGVIDEAGCPRSSHHILLHDLVLDVVLDVDSDVENLRSSFGGLRARY